MYRSLRTEHRTEYVMYGLGAAALAQALPRMQVRGLAAKCSKCIHIRHADCNQCSNLLKTFMAELSILDAAGSWPHAQALFPSM